MSFGKALTFRFLIVSLLPLLAMALFALFYLSGNVGETISSKNHLLASSLRSELNEFLNESERMLHHVHSVRQGNYFKSDDLSPYLTDLVRNSRSFEAIFILNHSGLIQSAGMASDIALSRDDYLGLDLSRQIGQDPNKRGVAWSPSFISVVTGKPTISVSVSNQDYIVAGNISLEKLFDLAGDIHLEGKINSIIVDRKGVVLYHPRADYVEQRLNISNLSVVRQGMSGNEGTYSYQFENERRLGSVVTLSQVGWSVIVSQDYDSAYKTVENLRMLLAIGLVLTALIAIVFAMRSAKHLLQPLHVLDNEVRRVAQSDYSQEHRHLRYEEFEQLSQSFDQMSEAVQERERSMQLSQKKFADLANLLPQTIFETNAQAQITYINETGISVFALRRSVLDEKMNAVRLFIPEQRARITARLHDCLEGKTLDGIECQAQRHNGEDFTVVVYANPIMQGDRAVGIRGVLLDATELKDAERRMQERIEIERAIAAISNQFISLPVEQTDGVILEALETIGHFFGADRAYVFLFENEMAQFSNTHEWCAEGVDAVQQKLKGLATEDFPWFMKQLLNLGIFLIPRVADMPDSAAHERGIFQQHGIQSLLNLPLVLGEETYGFIGLDSVRQEQNWTEEDILLLKMVGQTIVNAFERNHAMKDLQLSATVFDNSQEAIIITDSEQRIIQVNSEFTHLTGYREDEVIGEDPAMLSSGRHSSEFYRDLWKAINTHGHWEGEIWNRRKNGEVYPEWLSISRVADEQGNVTHFVGTFADITARKQAEDRLHMLAHYDALTKLPNRNLFQQRLNHALKQARRVRRKVAVMFLDLDRFKNVNDTLGHAVGDALLKDVSTRLNQCVRASDTVSRIGGDEFTFILEGVKDVQDITTVADKVLESLVHPFMIDDHEIFMTTSIGISVYPNDGTDEEALLKNADIAMYRAKDVGRNNYQFYTQDMNAKSLERLVLENSLRRALDRDEFVLFYQPQVDLVSGVIVGLEALIRWNNPDMGLVSPAQFIPLAEETGLIEPLGEWVLETACRQQREWQQRGYDPLRVAVNLSARQFHADDFVGRIAQIIKSVGMSHHHLELELTESIIMNNVEDNIHRLSELQEMGVQLSIDDFGTGYSSLSYLKRFPIDRLKIDRSFIGDLSSDFEDAAIVNAIIALAHSLKIGVIAEGVETIEQRDFLRENGCEEMQGFLFSPPVPVDVIEPILRDQFIGSKKATKT